MSDQNKVPTEEDVLALQQLATSCYRRYEATFAAAYEFAVAELVAAIIEQGLTPIALWEHASALLEKCKRTQNVTHYRRAKERERARVESTPLPIESVVTGDSAGVGLPHSCCVSEYRELLSVRLWNHKRVRDAKRDEILEHCRRLEAQATTNRDRARQLRALAAFMEKGETALTAVRRREQGAEDASWSKSTSMAS